MWFSIKLQGDFLVVYVGVATLYLGLCGCCQGLVIIIVVVPVGFPESRGLGAYGVCGLGFTRRGPLTVLTIVKRLIT